MPPQKIPPANPTALTPQIPAHLLHHLPDGVLDVLGDAGEGLAALADAGGLADVPAVRARDLEDWVDRVDCGGADEGLETD
jgi:hypothetical protein